MPMARMTSSEALSSTEMMLPLSTGLPRLFSLMDTAKKDGSAIRLNSTSSTSAAMGMNSCCRVSRLKTLSSERFRRVPGSFTEFVIAYHLV